MFEFIESAAFERVRARYLDDDEYRELQQFLMLNPEAGAIIRGSGGVRKLRWRRASSGCWHCMPRRSRRMRRRIF